MADIDPRLERLITRGREERNLEYKQGDAQRPFEWRSNDVKEKTGRTVMAMANIGGGSIVIGMRQTGPDSWEPEGVSAEVDATYQQDQILQWVNRRADPYVRLSVHHVDVGGRRFVIIDVVGFDDLPVVCSAGSGAVSGLRAGTIYTRSFEKYETREVQSGEEMREILDRAIERGVEKRLRPFENLLQRAQKVSLPASSAPTSQERFQRQRGDL